MLPEVQRPREAWGRACSSRSTRRVYGPPWCIHTVLIFEASSQQSLSLHQWPVSSSIENLKVPWKHLFVAVFGLSPLLSFSFEPSPFFPQRNSQIFYFKIMGLNQMIHLGPLPLRFKNKNNKILEASALLWALNGTPTSLCQLLVPAALRVDDFKPIPPALQHWLLTQTLLQLCWPGSLNSFLSLKRAIDEDSLALHTSAH